MEESTSEIGKGKGKGQGAPSVGFNGTEESTSEAGKGKGKGIGKGNGTEESTSKTGETIIVNTTISGVNYTALNANISLITRVENSMRALFAISAGVAESTVTITLSAGSLRIEARTMAEITFPVKVPSPAEILATLQAIPGFNAVKVFGATISATHPTAVKVQAGETATNVVKVVEGGETLGEYVPPAPGASEEGARNCASAVCPADICQDGNGRRQIGEKCCACPEEKCASAVCPADICQDGGNRRQIDEKCCACPEEVRQEEAQENAFEHISDLVKEGMNKSIEEEREKLQEEAEAKRKAEKTPRQATGTCHCMIFDPGASAGCSGACCNRGDGIGGDGFDSHCRAENTSAGCENKDNVFGQKFCAWTPSTTADLAKTNEQAAPVLGFTDYSFSGCHKPEAPEVSPNAVTAPHMTREKCFSQCRDLPGMRYFALTAGHTCYCSEYPLGVKVARDACSTRCEGDERQRCGGPHGAASVFTMFDCTPATALEKKKEGAEEAAHIVAAYAKMEGESCGHSDSNGAEIDNSPTLNGLAEYCMQACWFGYGAEDCQGFSYDASTSTCKFVTDVTDGPVEKDSRKTCYFKKIGFVLPR